MAEFKTPVKQVKSVDSNEKITIPPSPFLNRLGYGTGLYIFYFCSFWEDLLDKRYCPISRCKLKLEIFHCHSRGKCNATRTITASRTNPITLGAKNAEQASETQ